MQNTSPYPSSLTDEQWEEIQTQLPARPGGGRPPRHHYRDILNVIFYWLRTGGAWRYLPHDFAPWPTVDGSFRRWRQQGVWKKIHDCLVRRVRVAAVKKPTPAAAILDSQSVRCADHAGVRGGEDVPRLLIHHAQVQYRRWALPLRVHLATGPLRPAGKLF